MIYNSKNEIVNVSLKFALEVIKFCEELDQQRKWIVAKQLLRSGTSIGANINEAQNAESKADFIHKLKISAKEAEETGYWMLLCEYSENYPNPDNLKPLLLSIKKLLNKIIGSAKKPKPI